MNQLYKLDRLEEVKPDENSSFIIRASSEFHARNIAAEKCGDEGKNVWLDARRSTCAVLRKGGKPGVIMNDYWNG